jgi:chromate reductase, NAD(P)H dehydrogenase (quinone)
MRMAKILVLAGSTRTESVNRKLARQAVEALRTAGADATFADLRDYPLPLYDGDLEDSEGRPAAVVTLKEMARRADGFVIATPEHNGSYPAVLKNAIDWISRPEPGESHLAVFRGKVAGIASASPSGYGGVRGLKQLRELLGMIGIEVVAQQLGVANSGAAFDGEGRLARAEDVAGLDALATSVVRGISEKKLEVAA